MMFEKLFSFIMICIIILGVVSFIGYKKIKTLKNIKNLDNKIHVFSVLWKVFLIISILWPFLSYIIDIYKCIYLYLGVFLIFIFIFGFCLNTTRLLQKKLE
ncbi:MAG: hypothetical protein BKP49_03300 [Treponema sp. CETP13]|nr:MAG: hypothetical protein BKP49_03300 [Treponema sp. CETP13]